MKIVIAGGAGGLGAALIAALARRAQVGEIIATYRHNPSAADDPKVAWQRLDLADEAAIRGWAQEIGEIDWLINAAGTLHTPAQGPEKTIRRIDPDFFLENLRSNTLPTLLTVPHSFSISMHYGVPPPPSEKSGLAKLPGRQYDTAVKPASRIRGRSAFVACCKHLTGPGPCNACNHCLGTLSRQVPTERYPY